MGRLEATLAVLTMATAGCGNPKPEVEGGITLTNPELNRVLTCARETFGDVQSYSRVGHSSWGQQNCPGYADFVDILHGQLENGGNPLTELTEIRDSIFTRAGVLPGTETWVSPALAGKNGEGMVVTVDNVARQAAIKAGRVVDSVK